MIANGNDTADVAVTLAPYTAQLEQEVADLKAALADLQTRFSDCHKLNMYQVRKMVEVAMERDTARQRVAILEAQLKALTAEPKK